MPAFSDLLVEQLLGYRNPMRVAIFPSLAMDITQLCGERLVRQRITFEDIHLNLINPLGRVRYRKSEGTRDEGSKWLQASLKWLQLAVGVRKRQISALEAYCFLFLVATLKAVEDKERRAAGSSRGERGPFTGLRGEDEFGSAPHLAWLLIRIIQRQLHLFYAAQMRR